MTPRDEAHAASWLARNAVDSLPEGALAAKLATGRALRVKLGVDPTAPDIHLGFVVVLQKLREFQDLGHTVVLIVGDYTARVGDPSGRSATRPELDPAEIDANARSFHGQALAILDSARLEVRRNSEWLEMDMAKLFALLRSVTVARIIERDDFAKRLAARAPVSLLELLYPVLQGYDSVAIAADVELGGADQKFNLLLGRDIQRAYGMAEQAIMTLPLLTGTDGNRKMSKSYGNYVGLRDAPEEMYGKTMSIPDASLESWYALLLDAEPPATGGPLQAKRALAAALVARFHSDGAARAAQDGFDRVHVRREAPADVRELCWAASGDGADLVHLPALLREAFDVSGSEARRAIAQGGVKLDGIPVAPGRLDLPVGEVDGRLLQLGKRRFVRVRVDR